MTDNFVSDDLKPVDVGGCEISMRCWAVAKQIQATVDPNKLPISHLLALAVQIGMNQQRNSQSLTTDVNELHRLAEGLANKATELKRRVSNGR